jgi:hypothetical protein
MVIEPKKKNKKTTQIEQQLLRLFLLILNINKSQNIFNSNTRYTLTFGTYV